MNLDLLDYFHDATLRTLSWSVEDDGHRSLSLQADCTPDCGYQAWAGKRLSITFLDVLIATGTLWGHASGDEILNSISQGVSQPTAQRIQKLTADGIPPPRVLLTLTLQSGSELELACREVRVA